MQRKPLPLSYTETITVPCAGTKLADILEGNRDNGVIRPQCQYDSVNKERKEMTQFPPAVNENTWLPTSWDDSLQNHKLRRCKPDVLCIVWFFDLLMKSQQSLITNVCRIHCYNTRGFRGYTSAICVICAKSGVTCLWQITVDQQDLLPVLPWYQA
jgi:hypothetical protein